MADETPDKKVTLEEPMVSTLAMTDASAKLLYAKGVITDTDFKANKVSRGAETDELTPKVEGRT